MGQENAFTPSAHMDGISGLTPQGSDVLPHNQPAPLICAQAERLCGRNPRPQYLQLRRRRETAPAFGSAQRSSYGAELRFCPIGAYANATTYWRQLGAGSVQPRPICPAIASRDALDCRLRFPRTPTRWFGETLLPAPNGIGHAHAAFGALRSRRPVAGTTGLRRDGLGGTPKAAGPSLVRDPDTEMASCGRRPFPREPALVEGAGFLLDLPRISPNCITVTHTLGGPSGQKEGTYDQNGVFRRWFSPRPESSPKSLPHDAIGTKADSPEIDLPSQKNRNIHAKYPSSRIAVVAGVCVQFP